MSIQFGIVASMLHTISRRVVVTFSCLAYLNKESCQQHSKVMQNHTLHSNKMSKGSLKNAYKSSAKGILEFDYVIYGCGFGFHMCVVNFPYFGCEILN